MIVRWTREASRDLDDVLSYIASQNPVAAARVAERIERSVTILADFPRAGRLNPASGAFEWVVPGLPLLIIYTLPTDDLVEIIAVFHTSRDPNTKRQP